MTETSRVCFTRSFPCVPRQAGSSRSGSACSLSSEPRWFGQRESSRGWSSAGASPRGHGGTALDATTIGPGLPSRVRRGHPSFSYLFLSRVTSLSCTAAAHCRDSGVFLADWYPVYITSDFNEVFLLAFSLLEEAELSSTFRL